jgi:class 3 adenylate cyclase
MTPARPVRDAARTRPEEAEGASFAIFKREQFTIAQAEALLKATGPSAGIPSEAYGDLLTAYVKLFKNTRKLVRLADRNEAELNDLAKRLNDKNTTLEALSIRLAKYLPAQLYRSIFEGEESGELVTRRKKLTVFFSDIKDFAETTEDLQPEELTWILNDYFTEMSQLATEHRATINKFIGDAVSLFFGDTDSQGVEEDARACVRMAVAMQCRMGVLRQRWRKMGFQKPFRMRIGIATGYCNVGNFGSPDRMDYTIIGSTVNLAARLESVAPPDGIMISYETHAAVSDIIRAEPVPPLRLKGFPRPIHAHQVLNLMDEEGGGERFFTRELPGALLNIDFKSLSAEDRAVVAAELAKLAQRLAD